MQEIPVEVPTLLTDIGLAGAFEQKVTVSKWIVG